MQYLKNIYFKGGKKMINIQVEIIKYQDHYIVYMNNDGSSGLKYTVKSLDEIGKIVSDYIKEIEEYLL